MDTGANPLFDFDLSPKLGELRNTSRRERDPRFARIHLLRNKDSHDASTIDWLPLTIKNQGQRATSWRDRRSYCERCDHSLGGICLDDAQIFPKHQVPDIRG